jgi:hypothetical protein
LAIEVIFTGDVCFDIQGAFPSDTVELDGGDALLWSGGDQDQVWRVSVREMGNVGSDHGEVVAILYVVFSRMSCSASRLSGVVA